MTTALEVRRPAPATNGNMTKSAAAPLTPLARFDLLISGAKAALREAKQISEVKDVLDQAKVAEAYAEAHLSAEHVLYAQEVNLWASRRAGEIRRALPVAGKRSIDWRKVKAMHEAGKTPAQIAAGLGTTKACVWDAIHADFAPDIDPNLPTRMELDDLFGVSHRTGKAWEVAADLPEPEFNTALAEMRKAGKLSLNALLTRLNKRKTYVERGIYTLPDGRFWISWERHRRGHSRTLKAGTTIEEARVELNLSRGKITPGGRANPKLTAADAYAGTRRAAQIVSNLAPAASPAERAALAEAEGYLGKAADALNRAILAQK